MTADTEIRFLDCEASGLHHTSYPIEFGWSSPDLVSSGFLICPPMEWDLRDWRRDAELVHGISFEGCIEHGISVIEAAQRLNEALAGKTIHSDAPGYDSQWLRRLYSAAQIEPAFPLTLLRLEDLIRTTLREQGHPDWWADIDDLSRHVDARYPRTHRAEADARHMAAMYRSVCGLEP